ncbi:MAG: branched-chain amino acid transaminase [Spirochaetales bacterium]|nr:branched-chain amino acid transaminase [Spirochaetales bacterium]
MEQYRPDSVAYHQGEYRPLEQCHINIMTHALQYGTMVFGGMRAYWNADSQQLYVFRLKDHVERLLRSAHIMQMQSPLGKDEMAEVLLELARRNNAGCNLYFRPFIYKSALQLSPRLHDVKDDFSCYVIRLDDYLDMNRGLRVMVSSWRRIDENIIPTRAKVAGGYANSALAKSEAVQNGFDEAIFLDSRGMVSEGSAENLFLVRDGQLITPHLASSVLEGITRRSVIDIARHLGLPVLERDVARSELYIADELFFSGTGAQIAWITEVDRRRVGSGQIGDWTERIRQAFLLGVTGRHADFRQWVTPV